MTTASTAPLIAIEGLRTWFRNGSGYRRAVDGVSLHVDPGQSVGIVGESGSGKTQTFFSLFGLSSGSPGLIGGRARFDSIDLLEGLDRHVQIREENGRPAHVRKAEFRWERLHRARLKPILGRDVAMVFQESRRSLVPYWTVARHFQVVLRRIGRPESEAAELLSRLGFHDPARILASFPSHLSGGEAQRVLLALATAAGPRLLIADEPTTALDAVSQLRILGEIDRVHRTTGVALVLISHDLAVVAALVDVVVVLFGGRTIERLGMAALESAAADELHPYTNELRESQRRRVGGLPVAAVVMHAGSEAPVTAGCPYAARCARRPTLSVELRMRCGAEMPPMLQIAPGHELACWGVAT